MIARRNRFALAVVVFISLTSTTAAQPTPIKPRARDLGIPFDGRPGPLNAITDVAGVAVGHATLIAGSGKLDVGKGPIRTGVTAVLPRGTPGGEPVFAGCFSLNGNGEMTGTAWIEEHGFLEGPFMITNTHSVGLVRDAVIARRVIRREDAPGALWWMLPVVAETWDGYLNDVNGFHVKQEHVFQAIDSAKPGRVAEGNVGGGTGMICHEFKGGIGTSSRVLKESEGGFVVGALVQANHGLRDELRVAGIPVGREIGEARIYSRDTGSIIVAIATDAPLLPHQLKRIAKRATHGLARTGSISGNYSGDLFLAFSTARAVRDAKTETLSATFLPQERIDPLFHATAQAVEEAIINALVAAETMIGADDRRVIRLPTDRVREILEKRGVLAADRR